MIALVTAGALAIQAIPPDHNWITPRANADLASGRVVYMTGNDFLSQCRESESFCVLYIQGVNDGILATVVSTSRDLPYCLPAEATSIQVYAVVRKWLDDNPASLHKLASVLVAQALSEAWPQCGT